MCVRFGDADRKELYPAGKAFADKLERRDARLILLRCLVSEIGYPLKLAVHTLFALHNDTGIKAVRCDRKHRTIEGYRNVNLVPTETYRRHNICGSVRLREHIFYLFAGTDIPVGNAVLAHLGLPLGSKSPALSYRFHYFECVRVLDSPSYKVVHNIISAADNV